MSAAIAFENVTKSFGSARALDGLTFEVACGEVLGLVGPNGAGKTTALQIAAGFLLPSSGSGSLMGLPFERAAARRQLGFVPDAPVFFAGTALDAVHFAARLSDMQPSRAQVERVLTRVGLKDWHRDVRRFSRGMQQRLGLAQALIHSPKVLILDEPASALDPQGVVEVRTLLQELRAEGCAVLLSSHQLSEVAQVSDRIAFLHEGRLLRYGPLEQLLGQSDRVEITLRGFQPSATFLGAWGRPAGAMQWQLPEAYTRRFLEAAWAEGGELVRMVPVRRDLTSLFLAWTRTPGRRAQPPELREVARG